MSPEEASVSECVPENICLPVVRRAEPVTPASSAEESVVALIQGAADSVRELMSPCFSAHQLNDARFTLMRAIRNSNSGECSQSDLARCLKQSEANVSTLLDRMRGDGLVSREKSPFDRRRSVVRLSVRGEELLRDAEREYAARAQGILRSFAVFEIQSFRDQLRNFIAICAAELELNDAANAVAGRIGDSTDAVSNAGEGSEIRHAQAG